MTVDELALALGGEIVGNEARVRRNGSWIILGRIVGQNWDVTEVGQWLLDASNQAPVQLEDVPVAPTPPKRGRPRKVLEVRGV